MNAGEIIGLGSISLALLAFLADRVIKPWRERVLAEAEEKRAVALIQSEEMRSALRVLTGTPAVPSQGVKHVPSLGERMTAQEETLAEVKQLLNGGGLGSQMTEIGARVAQIDARSAEHIDHAAATRDELVGRLDQQDQRLEESASAARDARTLAGEAATTVSREVQRLADGLEAVVERVDALDIKVERRLFVVEDAERTHRAMLHEVGFEVDLPDPDDAA